MRKLFPVLALSFAALATRAEPLLPTSEGTSWEYESTETLTGAAPVHSIVTARAGKQLFEGKELVKLETLSGGAVTKTELVNVNEQAIVCVARSGKDGKMSKLNPPEIIVQAPLKVGAAWDAEGEVVGNKMHQHFTVVAEENVTVPADVFRAFHLQCEDSSIMSIKVDRWFVPGTGLVKESAVVRGPGVLQRVTLELKKLTEVIAKPRATPSPVPPKADAKPTIVPSKAEAPPSPTPVASSPKPAEAPASPEQEKPVAPAKKLTVEVSSEPAGGLKTRFKSNVANIYVRWHGHDLPEGAKVRVAWVAEDVGDIVEPNFIIDETESVAPTADASARFTLGRPPDGWAEGKYRVEFYLDDALIETIKVSIEK
ncbi:MAG TPA: hypothetical protein VK581_03620 [Chthoniobacterales bacterium]|nr:hypothetical protein [Chthoniobacterales bacterium]